MTLHVKTFQLTLILLHGAFVSLEGSASATGFGDETFSSLPEIRVTKWVSDADRDYIDVGDEDSLGILEWNENVDTAGIQISGFGSHEYVISQHVAAIYVECRAQYPVEWVFHYSKYVTEDLSGIRMKTFRRSHNIVDHSSDVYIATLEITTQSNRATGNYSCRSTSPNAHLSNDVFIFWEGSSPPYLVLSGTVLEVELEPSENFVNLPCYVSHPHKTLINLHKDVGGELKEVPSNINVSKFDPKMGFILTYGNISDVIGRYRCSSGDDDGGGLMEILVRNQSAFGSSICQGNTCFHRKVSSGARFYFDKNTEEIACCGTDSGHGKQTRLHTLFCSNPSVCRMYEPAVYLTSGGNGRRSENGSCVTEKIYPRDFGLVRCSGRDVDVFTYVYTEFWTPDQEYLRAVFDWKDLRPQNMIHVMIHSSAPYYNKQLITATCQTLHSYFSDGIKWAVKWRNGTMSYFDSIMSTEHDPRLHGIRSTYLRLSFELAELICFAPVWNSTEWVSKSLKLDVKASRSPTIVGNSVEELTLSLNETEKVLECTSKAEPPAKLKWTRNDQDVPRSMVIWNQNGTSVLLLKTVTYESNAVFKCIAKNEVGQAVKLFRIFVEDTRHAKWSLAFSVVIPILVISFLAIVAFLVWKVQLQKKVVNHLTRVVFREATND